MIDAQLPHRRKNPLTGEWILVSPHRAKRPWNGSLETKSPAQTPSYEPTCYLCPGNARIDGVQNPEYKGTHVFTNDHPSLIPIDTSPNPRTSSPISDNSSPITHSLINAHQENGISRVICYSEDHARSMSQLPQSSIQSVIDTWTHEYKTIETDPHISYVQIFENKGAIMGASNPHPHCQIWATEHVPTIPSLEQFNQGVYYKKYGTQLLLAYEEQEQPLSERIIYSNDTFTILVPYWATWPYETMILPKTPLQSLGDFTPKQRNDLAMVLSKITQAYDKIFDCPFPYSMGIHQKPSSSDTHPEWQFHMHFYPPLLRSGTIKKYYVGYELMAEAQRDITPESAAETIRKHI